MDLSAIVAAAFGDDVDEPGETVGSIVRSLRADPLSETRTLFPYRTQAVRDRVVQIVAYHDDRVETVPEKLPLLEPDSRLDAVGRVEYVLDDPADGETLRLAREVYRVREIQDDGRVVCGWDAVEELTFPASDLERVRRLLASEPS